VGGLLDLLIFLTFPPTAWAIRPRLPREQISRTTYVTLPPYVNSIPTNLGAGPFYSENTDCGLKLVGFVGRIILFSP